jgi:oligo-1,6-glucosidase
MLMVLSMIRSIPDEYKDVESSNYYRQVARDTNNDPEALEKAHAAIQHLARDHARTPMQWDASSNGGFSAENVKPWMRTNSSTKVINVEEQNSRKDSLLAFWRRVCKLRQTYSDVLVDGIFELIEGTGNEVFACYKRGERRSALVICNFSSSPTKVTLAEDLNSLQLIESNLGTVDSAEALEPWEGRVYLVG